MPATHLRRVGSKRGCEACPPGGDEESQFKNVDLSTGPVSKLCAPFPRCETGARAV